MASATIYRYEVPVDDRWHDTELRGPIVHVAARDPRVVEVWAIHDPKATPYLLPLRVFGTGHPIHQQVGYLGTALAPMGLVWHLVALLDPDQVLPGDPQIVMPRHG